MSIDPHRIWSESHAAIGRLIQDSAETLVDRWHERALAEQPNAAGTHRQELRDHLADYLRGLGSDLASRTSPPMQSTMHAVRHGEQRWHAGWQLTEVVRDYQILRLVILEWLEEALTRPVLLRETMAIGLALDESIAAAVVMYVRFQEEALTQSHESFARAKEAAEAANREKGNFLANISHELRTPMNSILGIAQLALEDQLPPTVADYFKTVQDSADVLLSLLNELLDYARLESGRLELDPHPFQLRTLLDETLRSFSVKADAKGLETACEVAASVPDLLVGDSLRLRQIVTNLVGNAIKFTEAGEVLIQVTPVSQTDDRLELEFVVADTGIGIPLEAQRAIFEPFAQAEASTTRRFGGTGLGLTISRELTQRMGGRLWVESEPGRGSHFHFTAIFDLPTSPAAESQAEETDPRLRGRTALVIDDHAPTRRIVENSLRAWGLETESFEDAAAAQARLTEASQSGRPLELLIVDARLAAESGIELIERVKSRGEAPERVIVMLNNIDRLAVVKKCQELGVSGLLIKPIAAADLLATVKDAFGLIENGQASAPAASEAFAKPRYRILLAEDTPANQKLFSMLLTRHGCEVVVVENGEQAAARCLAEAFDLVLMDLQMPVMDGLKATALIRLREKSRGGRVPIVALTAHALPRDRERCLAAGMDDYLSKPIDIHELERTIERLALHGSTTNEAPSEDASASATAAEPAIFDRQQSLKRLGGNQSLFADLVRFFFEDTPALLERLRRGVESRDLAGVRVAAHSLRGLAANFDGFPAMQAAQQVENLAFDARVEELAAASESLYLEVERLCQALRAATP